MTSESESPKRRRPPTIDLTATEIESEKPASAQDAAPDRKDDGPESAGSGSASNSNIMPVLASAALGAVVVAAIFVVLDQSGYLPRRQPAVQPVASTADGKAIADITAQLNDIQGALAAQQQPNPALVSRLTAIDAAEKSLRDSVAALSTRVDQVAGAAQAAQVQSKSAADAADTAKSTAQSGVARGDIDALTGRIAALESTVKSLSDIVKQQAASASDGAARLMIAAQALRAAIESGAPYQAELAAVKSLGAGRNAIGPLEPFAASGAPTAGALARELSALTLALMKAVAPAQNSDSFLRRLEVNARHLVRITPVDAPVGDDPQSVAARIDAEAAHADINAALADIAKLPDAAKSIVAAWVQKAQARNAALTASRQLAASALAALGKTADKTPDKAPDKTP